MHDRVYIPAAEAYQASMTALVKIQRDRIDALRLRNQDIKAESRCIVMLLGALCVALGIAYAW